MLCRYIKSTTWIACVWWGMLCTDAFHVQNTILKIPKSGVIVICQSSVQLVWIWMDRSCSVTNDQRLESRLQRITTTSAGTRCLNCERNSVAGWPLRDFKQRKEITTKKCVRLNPIKLKALIWSLRKDKSFILLSAFYCSWIIQQDVSHGTKQDRCRRFGSVSLYCALRWS